MSRLRNEQQQQQEQQQVPAGDQAAAVSHGSFNIPLSDPCPTPRLPDGLPVHNLEAPWQMDPLASWEASLGHISNQPLRHLAPSVPTETHPGVDQSDLTRTCPGEGQPGRLLSKSDTFGAGQRLASPAEWAGPNELSPIDRANQAKSSETGQMQLAKSLPLPMPWEDPPHHGVTKDWSRCQLAPPPTCQQLPPESVCHSRAGLQQPEQQGRSKRGRTLASERQNFLGPPPRPPSGTICAPNPYHVMQLFLRDYGMPARAFETFDGRAKQTAQDRRYVPF